MKKKNVLIILTIANFSVFSQSVFDKADSLFYSGDLELAIEQYQAHSDSLDSNFFATSKLACVYSLNGNKDSAFIYLENLLEQGATEWVLGQGCYYFIYKDERWEKIQSNIREYVISKGYTKPDLCLELMEMGMFDQVYYFDMDVIRNKVGRSSFLVKHFWQLKKELNAQNLDKLEKIIKEQSYPKISEVGIHAASIAFLVVQHSNLDTQKKYLPILTELAQQDEIVKEDWALLLDRVLVQEGKEQIYGSQVHKNPETGKYELYPVEDEKNLNKRRAKIDLIPIEEYLKFMGIVYQAPK